MRSKEKFNKIKNKRLIIKFLISIVIIFLIIFFGKYLFYGIKNNNDISGVRKVLFTNYDSINYINNGIIGIKNNSQKVYDYNGVYLFKNDNIKENIVSMTKDFYIVKDNKYIIKNMNNNIISESENKQEFINNYLIKEEKNNKYKIINIALKELYNNVSEIILKDNLIQIKINNTYYILDEKGNILLNEYQIEDINKGKNLKNYSMIVKKNNYYSYYSFNQNKIIESNFISYEKYKNKYIIKDNKNNEYIINKYDKKEKLKKKIDNKSKDLYEKLKNDNKIIFENNNHYVYKDTEYIKFYDINKEKKYKYELLNNEEILNNTYKDVIFINNVKDDYCKVINYKASTMKKINNMIIDNIAFNNNKIYIIVKKNSKYGLYIAE